MREPMPANDERLTVGYPGRDGAHSAAACDRLFPGGAELVPAAELQCRRRGCSVRSGRIRRPADRELARGAGRRDARPPVRLAARDHARRRCCRSATASSAPPRHELEDIRVVHSHPVALDQCRQLLAGMPWATAIAAATTADAAAQVAEHGDPAEVAIASERAATLHGLTVIADDVGDHPEAYTRFVSIATLHAARRERRTLADRLLVRHRSPAGRAPPRDRAVRAPRHRPPAARLPPDPAVAVALPLRRGARRPPARRNRARDARASSARARVTCASSAPILRTGTMNDPRAPPDRPPPSRRDLRTSTAPSWLRQRPTRARRRAQAHKEEHGISFVDPDRERELLDGLLAANAGPLSESGLAAALRRAARDLTKREVSRDGAS